MTIKALGFHNPPPGWFTKTGEVYITPTGTWMLQLFNYQTKKFDFYRYSSIEELHTCLKLLLLLNGNTYRVENI